MTIITHHLFQNTGQISINISDKAADEAFGVFPTVLSPGEGFTLILRDSTLIPVMDKDNTFEIQLNAKYLDSGDDKMEAEKHTIFVKLLKPHVEIPRLWKAEQTFKLNQRLTEGIVGKIGVKNLGKTDLNKFNYQLFGGFTDL